MNASELRIKNIYSINGQEKVLCNDLMCKALNNEIKVKAIPLTEEWLLKFGFEKEENIHKEPENIHYRIKIDWAYFLIQSLDNGKSFYLGCLNERRIEHAHELQNLIFVLTGTELELKETTI